MKSDHPDGLKIIKRYPLLTIGFLENMAKIV